MSCIHIHQSEILYHWLTTHLCNFDKDDIYVMVTFKLSHLKRLQNHIVQTYRIKTPLYLPSPDGQYDDKYWQEISLIKQWADNMLLHFDFRRNQLLFNPASGFRY